MDHQDPSKDRRYLQHWIKNSLDKVIALLGCPIALPIGIIVAAAILVEDGLPVFFVQQRLGKGAEVFRMYKFRSMKVNSPLLLNADGSAKVGTFDPRITRVGAFLRRTSIDELPQLINVLLGHMSLVGPRPDLPEHLALYSDYDKNKLRMRPGITGLPQVMGRNEMPWKERIKLDIKYIDDFSIWLDARILLATVVAVIRGHGVVAKEESQ